MNGSCREVRRLQVTRPTGRDAILHSATFEPLFEGHIRPNFFIVRRDRAKQVQQLLKKLGFSIIDDYKLPLADGTREREQVHPIVVIKKTRSKRRPRYVHQV